MHSKTNINMNTQSGTKRNFKEEEFLVPNERQRRQDALKAPVSTIKREASTWDITRIPDDATRFKEEADFFEPDKHIFVFNGRKSSEAGSWEEDEDEIDSDIENEKFFVPFKSLNVGQDRNRYHDVKKNWEEEAATVKDNATRFMEDADFVEPDEHLDIAWQEEILGGINGRKRFEAGSWEEDEDEIDSDIEKEKFFVPFKSLNVEAKTWEEEAATVQDNAAHFMLDADFVESDEHLDIAWQEEILGGINGRKSSEAGSWEEDIEDEIDSDIEKEKFFVPFKSLNVEAKTWEEEAATVQDNAARFMLDADFVEPDEHLDIAWQEEILGGSNGRKSSEAGSWEEDIEDEIDSDIEKEKFFVPFKSLNVGKDRNRCHDVKKIWGEEAATVQDNATRFMEDADFVEPDEHLVDRNKRNEASAWKEEILGGIDCDTEDEKTCVPYESLIMRKYSDLCHYVDTHVQNTKREASALEEKLAAVEDYTSRFMQEEEATVQNERKHRKSIACEKQIAMAERMCMLFSKQLKKYKKILDKKIVEQLVEIKIELAELSEGIQLDLSLNCMLYEVINIEKQIAAYQQSKELVDCRLILINSAVTALKKDLLEYKCDKFADQGEKGCKELIDFNFDDVELENWMRGISEFYKQ